MRAFSVVAVGAAAVGALVSYGTYWAMCLSESGGSTMCPDGEPTNTMDAQLIVGLVGVLPAVAMAFFAFRGARRPAVAMLVLGLMLWAGWAFLNDAAVHEWGS